MKKLPMHWTEPSGCTSDRGWLKALTGPFDMSRTAGEGRYTSETMPVHDDEVPGGWREQSTLGHYLDYAGTWTGTQHPEGTIHCYSVVAHTVRWVATLADARAFLESEALRVRQDLEPITEEGL